MSRRQFAIPGCLLAATFLFLLLPEVKASPAAIWPSVIAVALAFLTREIYSSLFLGAFAGAILLSHGNVFKGFVDLFATHLLTPLTSRWNVCAIVFSLMMGGFVELLNRSGGMQALAARLLGSGDSKRRAGLGAYLMGWFVFFDGLANCMLVGKTMRPITDRAGVSREKLAFIVDSTASPIAAFALISTWIAYEMSLIAAGFEPLGGTGNLSPYSLLIQSLPYRFYNYFILLIVFLTIWLGRDLGPMRAAEARKRARPEPAPDSPPSATHSGSRIALTLVPLALLIAGVFGGLYFDGMNKLGAQADGLSTVSRTIQAFGRADADIVFVCATAFASLVAMALIRLAPFIETRKNPVTIFFEGMREMFLPVLILVFAFTLNSVITELETAKWLVQVMEGNFTAAMLPSVVFLLAAVISFSTGTSWGTMGILMPLCIPVAAALTQWNPGIPPGAIIIGTIGAVLTGAVFGDHCSPISDTTIVSAFASGCDTIEHVRTQIPYALWAGGIAVFIGYLPAGLGLHPAIVLPAGAAACWALVRFRARPPETSTD